MGKLDSYTIKNFKFNVGYIQDLEWIKTIEFDWIHRRYNYIRSPSNVQGVQMLNHLTSNKWWRRALSFPEGCFQNKGLCVDLITFSNP